MTRTMSGWTARADSLSVIELTFDPSRPTTTMTRRRTSRSRRSPTTSPKEHAHARARRHQLRWMSPRRRRRLHPHRLLQPLKTRRWARRHRSLCSSPLRRHHPTPQPTCRYRIRPQRRRHLPKLQPQPQQPHHAATLQESAAPPHACLNTALWPTEKAITNLPTTSLTASWACCVPNKPLVFPPGPTFTRPDRLAGLSFSRFDTLPVFLICF